MVRLVKAERIPSHCGVCVEAIVKGRGGTVLVEPTLRCAALELESMLVEPDSSGKATIVLSNHSVSAVCLRAGRKIGFAQSCEQYVGSSEDGVSFREQAERGGDICEVTVDSTGGRKEKLRDLLHLPSGYDAVGELVLEVHDVFAVEKGERGEVKEVSHEIAAGDSKAASVASSVFIAKEH